MTCCDQWNVSKSEVCQFLVGEFNCRYFSLNFFSQVVIEVASTEMEPLGAWGFEWLQWAEPYAAPFGDFEGVTDKHLCYATKNRVVFVTVAWPSPSCLVKMVMCSAYILRTIPECTLQSHSVCCLKIHTVRNRPQIHRWWVGQTPWVVSIGRTSVTPRENVWAAICLWPGEHANVPGL